MTFPATSCDRSVARSPQTWLTALLCLVSTFAAAEDLHFGRLDRSYTDFVEELEPIEIGPATIGLVSPHQTLTLLSHRASLSPLGGQRFAIHLQLEVEGSGQLNAAITMGLVKSHLEDDLVLPRQTIDGQGEIRIERGEAGYDITLLRSQEHIEVDIRSRLAGRIVPLCRQMGLVLIRMDCAALESALSRVSVPLPPPGTQFFLSDEELTREDIARLDELLPAAPLQSTNSGDA